MCISACMPPKPQITPAHVHAQSLGMLPLPAETPFPDSHTRQPTSNFFDIFLLFPNAQWHVIDYP